MFFKKMAIMALLVVSLLGSSFILIPAKTSAVVDPACNTSSSFLGFPTWYKYLDVGPTDTGPCEVKLPLNRSGNTDLAKSITPIAMAIFEIILRVAGLASVGFIIYGGFLYLISQGEPDKTKGAKSTILNAVIGLLITMSAVTIVNLIGRNI